LTLHVPKLPHLMLFLVPAVLNSALDDHKHKCLRVCVLLFRVISTWFGRDIDTQKVGEVSKENVARKSHSTLSSPIRPSNSKRPLDNHNTQHTPDHNHLPIIHRVQGPELRKRHPERLQTFLIEVGVALHFALVDVEEVVEFDFRDGGHCAHWEVEDRHFVYVDGLAE
jgi:hypothetical protein